LTNSDEMACRGPDAANDRGARGAAARVDLASEASGADRGVPRVARRSRL